MTLKTIDQNKVMQTKTIFFCLLLLISASISSCRSTAPGGANPQSVAEAEAQLAKQRKEQDKINAKAKKEAEKRYWSMQSKQAKESVKRNAKRQKEAAKNRR